MSAINPASKARLQISAIAEVTRGTTPTTPGYTVLPTREGSSLNLTKQFQESSLIRSDRSPSPSIGGVYSDDGSILMPLIKEEGFLMFLESALSAARAALSHSAISVSFTSGTKKMTRATGSWLTEAPATRFEIGDLVFAAGTANQKTTLNNGGSVGTSDTTFTLTASTAFTTTGGYLKIDSEIIKYSGISANVVTVTQRGACGTTAATHTDATTVLPGRTITAISALDITFGNDTVVTESAVSTTFTTNVTYFPTGTTRKFFSVEEQFADITYFENYQGVEVNTFNTTFPTSGEIDVEFGMVGLSSTQGQVAGSTYTATAGKTPAAASITGSSLSVNGTTFVSCVENLTANLNNQRAAKFGVGNASACFVEEGVRQYELSFQAYLVDGSQRTLYQNETRFSLSVVGVSADLDRVGFFWPRLVYTGDTKQVSGQTIAESLTARAEYDSTTGIDFYMRVWAWS